MSKGYLYHYPHYYHQYHQYHRRWRIWCIMIMVICVTACGAGEDFQLPARNLLLPDINPQPSEHIKTGGTFRVVIQTYPTNFNYNQMDGSINDTFTIMHAVLPSAFVVHPDGSLSSNHAYFTDISQTWRDGHQVLTYTINPRAHWSDGTAITWRDFAAQAKALSGHDSRYMVSASAGYEDIASVTPGVDAQQAVVTMAQPCAEWQDLLFSLLYPASVQDTPEKFNTSLVNHTPPTAGAFTFSRSDKVKKVIILRRDPHWWGEPAKLDTLQFQEISGHSGIDPYMTHEVDTVEVNGEVSSLHRGLAAEHTDLRRGFSSQYVHITFNNAPGRITHDVHVRRAIAAAIDRQFLLYAYAGAITGKNPPILNNHFFFLGQPGYRDNSTVSYNPRQAREELAADGWRLGHDGIRYKNGQSLTIVNVGTQASGAHWQMIVLMIQAYLRDIGVRMIIHNVPAAQFFPDYLNHGQFDTSLFIWAVPIATVSSGKGMYYQDQRCVKTSPQFNSDQCSMQQNYGLQGNTAINAAYTRLLHITDRSQFQEEANHVDQLLWQDMGQLPLFEVPLVWAMDSRIANYGIMPLEAIDWAKVGWMVSHE